MAIGYGVACPKGKTKRQLKARKDRDDAKQLKRFRDAVWAREAAKLGLEFEIGAIVDYGKCQHCGYLVERERGNWMTGEVHHRIFRGNKATRYDPNNGVLLCNGLVNNCHELAELKRIKV